MCRKCAYCGKELDKNFYLCSECYGEKGYKYGRVVAYSQEQDYTRVYDFLEGFTAKDIDEFLDSISCVAIIKDYLPYFLEGDLPLLHMNELADAPVMRRGVHGFPKTHVIRKNNDFSYLHVKIANRYYISSTCFEPVCPSLEFKDIFLRNAPGKCLLCDEELHSFDHYLCTYHYSEFANKQMYFKLNVKFGEIECLGSHYNHPYTCKDGHKVMSEAEQILDDYFFDKGIKHAYEPKIYVNNVPLTPDFCIYLNDEPVYIEYWGVVGDGDYENSKKYKLDHYHKSNLTLINIYNTPLHELISCLEERLLTYKPYQINFEE